MAVDFHKLWSLKPNNINKLVELPQDSTSIGLSNIINFYDTHKLWSSRCHSYYNMVWLVTLVIITFMVCDINCNSPQYCKSHKLKYCPTMKFTLLQIHSIPSKDWDIQVFTFLDIYVQPYKCFAWNTFLVMGRYDVSKAFGKICDALFSTNYFTSTL